jgi:hypothetical protein
MIIMMAISLTCIILTIITSIFSVLAYAKVVGMEKSTHQIAWKEVPIAADYSEEALEKEEKRKDELLKSFDKLYNGHDLEHV